MSKLTHFDIGAIFNEDARSLISIRNKAKILHNTNDIKASGNEVEIAVRDFFKKRMPNNYYIGNGHIVDCSLKTSPQFDILISNNPNMPVLLKTNDGTEYFPIESVYSIGEVKSTYYKSQKPIENFCESLQLVKDEMNRDIIYNTFYNGILKDETLLMDMILSKPNKVLNAILSFMFFVNSGDFDISDFKYCLKKYGNKYLPNFIIFLDKGVIYYGKFVDDKMIYEIYPEFCEDVKGNIWKFGVNEGYEGNHLGFLYYSIITHLNNSQLEPISFISYFNQLLIGSKSKTIDINVDV